MPLTSSSILFRKPAEQSDASSNGGRMTAATVGNNVRNAIFPDVRQAERMAGSDKWRKLFIHFAPPDNSQALDVRVIPFRPTPAGDCVAVYPGTQTDTQAAIASSPPARAYAVATLASAASAGATTLSVSLEPGIPPIFAAGDTLYVTDKTDIAAATGHEEYVTLAAAAAPSGGTQTLTLQSPLVNSYAAGETRVASVILAGDVLPSASDLTVSSANGIFNLSAVGLSPAGCVEETWTLAFSSATAYALSGANAGNVGSGTITGTLAPLNSAFGGQYLSIPPAAFGGTFAAGDSVVFKTHPAAIPLWLRRIVPAGISTYADNSFVLAVDLESA